MNAENTIAPKFMPKRREAPWIMSALPNFKPIAAVEIGGSRATAMIVPGRYAASSVFAKE